MFVAPVQMYLSRNKEKILRRSWYRSLIRVSAIGLKESCGKSSPQISSNVSALICGFSSIKNKSSSVITVFESEA